MPAKSPCRLYVLFARDADVGVILRRGPTRWVQIIKWDTKHDAFEDGAWFHGRIYEDRCDVSPDGQAFVYFAAKHAQHSNEDGYGYSWTAVSRPPWLFALTLWPNPLETWLGGGRFLENKKVSIRTYSSDVPQHHRDHPPPRNLIVIGDRNAPCHTLLKAVPGADWSGRDRRGRIVYANGGSLFRRVKSDDHELISFNDRVPDPRPAPAWAQRWFRWKK